MELSIRYDSEVPTTSVTRKDKTTHSAIPLYIISSILVNIISPIINPINLMVWRSLHSYWFDEFNLQRNLLVAPNLTYQNHHSTNKNLNLKNISYVIDIIEKMNCIYVLTIPKKLSKISKLIKNFNIIV